MWLKRCLNAVFHWQPQQRHIALRVVSRKRSPVGLQKRGCTAILLLHNSQPRTNFYAIEHIQQLFYNKYSIPVLFSRKLISALFADRLSVCVRRSTDFPYLGDLITNFARDLSASLQIVVPEFGPVMCLPSYLYDQPSIVENLLLVMKEESAVDRLIVVSLYPFLSDRLTRPMFDSVRALLGGNSPVASDASTMTRQRKEPDTWRKFIASDMRSVFFSYLLLDDLGSFDDIVKCWAHELLRFSTPDVEGVIFAVPLSYWCDRSKIDACAWRVVREMHEASRTVVSHMRVAYFPSWNELDGPLVSLFLPTVSQQLSSLRKAGHSGTILVVPFANFFDDFDTQTVLPALLENFDGVKIVQLCEIRKSLLNTLLDVFKSRMVKLESSQ